MALYRAHFLDHADDIFDVAYFDAEHDEAAIAHAARSFVATIGKGYEIWQDDRLVHTEEF